MHGHCNFHCNFDDGFCEKYMPMADRLYDEHLEESRKEGLIK